MNRFENENGSMVYNAKGGWVRYDDAIEEENVMRRWHKRENMLLRKIIKGLRKDLKKLKDAGGRTADGASVIE